ncbi:MAG: hypothetical protein HQK51_05185 [Oligoflexia bacterium]|nr:hypothetical protein [Oligoflexia bacterium]
MKHLLTLPLLLPLLLLLTFLPSLNLLAMPAWNPSNDPKNVNAETETPSGIFQYNFDQLPLSGSTSYKPWTDTYWPSNSKGLANRWQTAAGAFYLISPSKNKILKMSQGEIAKLSPAEKYDIFVGDFNYALTKSEKKRTSILSPGWNGICHGWAPASYLFKEPNAVTVTSADGIKLPFGSSDIKGLLSLLQGNYNSGKTYMAGNRCNQRLTIHTSDSRKDNCLDINAGAFHVIMANRLGILGRAFVIDRSTDYQVWNQPVYAFRSNVIRSQMPTTDAAIGTVEESVIHTTITYTDEIDPNFYPQNKPGREDFRIDKEYTYILELDANKNIIGGKWISKDYPDFLWVQEKAPFTGRFAALESLYKFSTENK